MGNQAGSYRAIPDEQETVAPDNLVGSDLPPKTNADTNMPNAKNWKGLKLGKLVEFKQMDKLGSGASGTVYKAELKSIKLDLALKIINRSDF